MKRFIIVLAALIIAFSFLTAFGQGSVATVFQQTYLELTSYVKTALLYIEDNNVFIQQRNAADDGYVNMFKINASDEIETGAVLNVDSWLFEDDSGAVSAMDMGVTSTPSDGDEESYTFAIDSNNILKIKSSADGSGGVDEIQTVHYGITIYESEDVTCASNAGTASVWYNISYITTENNSTADVLTLADGTKNQIKTIVFDTDGGDDLEITPTNFVNGTKITLDTAGENVRLLFDGTNWVLISHYGGVVS